MSLRRRLAAAMLCTTLAVIPVVLVGAQAVLVREELGFGESLLGAAVSVWYLTAALVSVGAGRLGERLGAERAMLVAALASAVALLSIALFARSWWHLAALLVVGAVANALAQPAINLALARHVPVERQGLAFGLKQAAVPAATFVAGLAVPIIGLTLGWRWAFGLAALGAAGLWLLQPPAGPMRARLEPSPDRTGDANAGPVAVLGVAGAFGVGATSALTAFYVESAVARGMQAGHAGVWLSIGSLTVIGARVLWGWAADVRGGRSLTMVIGLLVAGAVGFVALAFAERTWALAVGTLLTFAAGWGWAGLLHFAVVRQSMRAPAAATGILMAGMRTGGVVGPLSFGLMVERTSYFVTWLVAAGAMVVAAVMVLVGLRRMRVDIRNRTRAGVTS